VTCELRHIGIVVNDISRYEIFLKKIGFVVFYDETEGGLDIKNLLNLDVEIKIKKLKNECNNIIEILKYPKQKNSGEASPNTTGLNHVAMTVSDLDETIQIFLESGGELIGEIVEKENVKLCYIFDIERNIFELVEECEEY